MLRLHFDTQIAASIQKQQGSYRAVITVQMEGQSNDVLTMVWCGALLSQPSSNCMLEDMKVQIHEAVTWKRHQGAGD